MIIKFVLSLLLATFLLVVTTSAKGGDLFTMSEENRDVIVNNRILTKVNGNPITVIDLMKKLDVVFYREFPQYASSKMARYQFYMANWKPVLQDLINKELISADAEDNKLIVNNGDVRQEMESIFGPNIIANLDKIGMTMDEACKIIKGDITIRRMMMIRVNQKAVKQIGPLEVRKAYEQYAKENVKSDEWHYHVISIREKDAAKGAAIAEKIESVIKENPALSFTDLSAKIKELPSEDRSIVNISEELVHNDLQLSPAYKTVLSSMTQGTYTEPLSQKSRADNKTVYRIFYLKEKVPGGVPEFSTVEIEIRDKLLQQEIEKESVAYIKKLQKHYGVSENLTKEIVADDFQPFSLQ